MSDISPNNPTRIQAFSYSRTAMSTPCSNMEERKVGFI